MQSMLCRHVTLLLLTCLSVLSPSLSRLMRCGGLCSDFCPHAATPLHDDLSRCTRALFLTVIPRFCGLLNTRALSPSDGPALVQQMHRHGINVRWLGVVRANCHLDYVCRMILIESVTLLFSRFLYFSISSAFVSHSKSNVGLSLAQCVRF